MLGPRVLGRTGLAWGPRVLGRTGLAWGAKGPGPDRLGLLHFQKVPYLIGFNLRSRNHIEIMTAFLQCFWISTQIGFTLFWNLMSSFGKAYDPFCTVFLGASFVYFFKKFKIWNHIFRFSRFQTHGNRFWGLGTFLHVFCVQKIIDLFTALQILYKFSTIFHKSFSYEPSRQYGISPFSKTILKYSI